MLGCWFDGIGDNQCLRDCLGKGNIVAVVWGQRAQVGERIDGTFAVELCKQGEFFVDAIKRPEQNGLPRRRDHRYTASLVPPNPRNLEPCFGGDAPEG